MIVNFGSLNIDYVYDVEHFVQPGETLSSYEMTVFPGGKGLNQSIAAARAGGRVMHAGMYAKEGRFLYDMLKEAGAGLSALRETEGANGHAIIQVDSSGENCILLFEGANGKIDEAYIDDIISGLDGSETVLFQNETTCIAYAMGKAVSKGCTIAFNPAPMNEKVKDYPLDCVDILIVNLPEGRALSGEDEPERIIDSLWSINPRGRVILTMGERGVWFKDGSGMFHTDAYKAEKVEDTTAAGDTFIGYYLSALEAGAGDSEAIKRAAKAAAVCVSRKGAAVSIPFADEI